MTKQRLSKVLATAGVASRRACEEIIFEGRVSVNGEVVKVPQTMVSLKEDELYVDGEPIGRSQVRKSFVLNKPLGYVCSNSSTGKHTRLVIDLFQHMDLRLFTVGRLDKNTGGLIIVTNDGQLSNKIIHPSSNVEKEYLVKTNKEITHEHLVQLSKGCRVEGIFVKPIKVSKVRRGSFKVVVKEGRKHEVRILTQNIGLEVIELTRIRIGNLRLGNMLPGQFRQLSNNDIDSLLPDKRS